MSNYDWERDKTRTFTVGAEIINGTGQVIIRSGDERDLYATMTADEALDVGRVIINQAFEAKKAKWREDNTGHGPSKVSFAALRAARARMDRLRVMAEDAATGSDQGDYGSGQAAMARSVLEILNETD